MTERQLFGVAAIILLALLALSKYEHQEPNAGLPVVQAAAPAGPPRQPPPKPAHARRLNSVCQIDEHQTPEHVV